MARLVDVGPLVEVSCPACRAEGPFKRMGARNGFRIVGCSSCGCIFVNPRPSEASLDALNRDYVGAVEALGGQVAVDARSADLDARYHVNQLLRFIQGGRLLDVGSGDGSFLLAASRHFEVSGIDLSPRSRTEARDFPILTGQLRESSFSDGFFDVVSVVETLEHVFDPRETLQEVRRIIRSGGFLLLQTGDAGSLLAKLNFHRWPYVQPPVHLNFFTRRSLWSLLSSVGFRLVGRWSFGRAPHRLPLVRSLPDHEIIRPVLDLGARLGLLGEAYVGVKAMPS